MCGRYALSLRPSAVRQLLEEQNMPSDDAPSDDDPQLRQSYNFAPGYHGLIYRAATNDRGFDATPLEETDGEPSPKKAKLSHPTDTTTTSVDGLATRETKYKLQSAKWGLIPFWTKRSPDYGNMMRTINCRDDSLAQPGGMWNTMKQRKRCIVIAEGFYEWLKTNNGKVKTPHFVKRKDGGLMCLAGLWDCVVYEDDDATQGKEEEKLYTYTIITTDSNKQLNFLHDRMPVILEPGSEEMKRWLDPSNIGWNKELQSMLVPFRGELECYPVDREVGKVGNNSPNFVIPIDSKENKKNIANFFGNQKAKQASASPAKAAVTPIKEGEHHTNETRETSNTAEDPESNAPLPKAPSRPDPDLSQVFEADLLPDSALIEAADEGTERNIKREEEELDDEALLEAEKSPPRHVWSSPLKPRAKREASADLKPNADVKAVKWEDVSPTKEVEPPKTPSKKGKTRSATTNPVKTPVKSQGEDGKNKKITAFFGGK